MKSEFLTSKLQVNAIVRLMLILFILSLSLTIRTTQAHPASSIVYVNVSNTSGIEDGTQTHPYRTISRGLLAVSPGGTVLVYPGTYVENLVAGGYGGYPPQQFTLKSLAGPAVTVIDGSNRDSVLTIHDGQFTIEGFTIKNGNGSPGLATVGYGIVIYPSSDTRVVIRNNIIRNTGLRSGIGISTATIDVHIEALIENNQIVFNSATVWPYAGGINIDLSTGSGWAMIRNNIIAYNQGQVGGGVQLSVFCGNNFRVDAINNTIIGNMALHYGGGVRINAMNARLANNIMVGNKVQTQSNDLDVIQLGESAIIEFNDIGDGQLAGTNGNTSFPPLLVDPANGDYHLTANSLCINAGTATNAPPNDFEGDSRPYGSGVDIGADEFVWPAENIPPVSNALSPRVADPSFTVSWQGTDQGGSGIDFYDIQVKDGAQGIWTDWLTNTALVQSTFSGQVGHTYYFQSHATDRAGNVEAYPGGDGDTHAFVGPDLSLSTKRVAVSGEELISGTILTYTISIRNAGSVDASALVTDTLPNFTGYVSASLLASTGQAIYDPDLGENGTILWNGVVSQAIPVNITFQVALSISATAYLPIRNVALIDDGWGHIYERMAFTPSHDIYLPLVSKSY